MSIQPTNLQLLVNSKQIEQNQAVIVSALLFDNNGNPVPNIEVSLYVGHLDYGGELLLDHEPTNVRGIATFEIPLRSVGSSTFVARVGALTSPQVSVVVSPTSLVAVGPTSWNRVVGSQSRLEVDLNTVIAKMIAANRHPTKEDICVLLGLDYTKANDRARVTQAVYRMKWWFDYLWRILYEPSSAHNKEFADLMRDEKGYSSWKTAPNSPVSVLKATYHLGDDEIHEFWVLSKMWDNFVKIANKWNLHLLIAYNDGGTWRYKRPDFWEYDNKQILSASRLFKGVQTILLRHRDFGMVLTSGQSVYKLSRVSTQLLRCSPIKHRRSSDVRYVGKSVPSWSSSQQKNTSRTLSPITN